MRFRVPALFMAIVAVALSSPLQATPVAATGNGAEIVGPFCGATGVSRDEQLSIQKQVDEWMAQHAGTLAVGGTIKIAWHVISDGATGNIPQSQIDAQIAVLNAAYAGIPGGVNTGYTFSLASVDRTNNRRWFGLDMGTTLERQAKRALAIDVLHRLNIYTCMPPSQASWATFPWTYPEGDYMTGVVIQYGYLPGGSYIYFNSGDVGVHEVGHYLGLFHTFQGGCTPPGDGVDDTPDEGISANSNCPEGRDSCPSAGLDPIHNYMDYTVDACRTEFTPGQDARMDIMVPMYRPNLLNAPFTQNPPAIEFAFGRQRRDFAPANGVSFQGATPNPFRSRTDIRFSIPVNQNAGLQVFNAGGQLVTTLQSGAMGAGDHSVSFSGENLPSGIYFAVLRVDGQSITRSLVLSR